MLIFTLFILRGGNDNIYDFLVLICGYLKLLFIHLMYKSILYFDTIFIRFLHNFTTNVAYKYVLNQMA